MQLRILRAGACPCPQSLLKMTRKAGLAIEPRRLLRPSLKGRRDSILPFYTSSNNTRQSCVDALAEIASICRASRFGGWVAPDVRRQFLVPRDRSIPRRFFLCVGGEKLAPFA